MVFAVFTPRRDRRRRPPPAPRAELAGSAGALGAAGAGGRRARRPALHGDALLVRVRLAPRRLVQDGLGQLREGAVDVDVRLRRRLHEADAVLPRYLYTTDERYLMPPFLF